jgi:rRNA maturation endonuclease Nob1
MKCPKCQNENRESVKFCEECGAKFEIECPECRAKIPVDKKFCGECGHNLSLPSEAPINP